MERETLNTGSKTLIVWRAMEEITQEGLASVLGCGSRAVYSAESGQVPVKLLKLLLDVIGIPFDAWYQEATREGVIACLQQTKSLQEAKSLAAVREAA